MTTERDAKPVAARKSRRPHPAKNARLITAGAAAGLTFGVVAALAISDSSVAARGSVSVVSEQAANAPAPLNVSLAPMSPKVTVIRRVHYLPTTVTEPLVPSALAVPVVRAALAVPVVFTPQPAVRSGVKLVALPSKRSVVRRAVAVKRQVPTRRARRATRAS